MLKFIYFCVIDKKNPTSGHQNHKDSTMSMNILFNTSHRHQRHYIDHTFEPIFEPTLANQKSRVSFSFQDWAKHQQKTHHRVRILQSMTLVM